MPIYTITHQTPLSPSQKDALAASITHIHAKKFRAPSLFVNVVFVDSSEAAEGGGSNGGGAEGEKENARVVRYVAGKRKNSNQITANVRHGPSRTQIMYNDLCSEITAAWNNIVNADHGKANTGDRELRAIFILGDIVAGSEAGFPLPEAGKDKEWIEENMAGFRKRAEEGDEEFGDLVEEIGRRGEEFGIS